MLFLFRVNDLLKYDISYGKKGGSRGGRVAKVIGRGVGHTVKLLLFVTKF